MNFHYTDHLKKLERPSLSEDIHSTFIRLDRNEAPFSAFDIVEGIINQSELKTLNNIEICIQFIAQSLMILD